MGHGVTGFECGNDALRATQLMKGSQRLVVGGSDVFGSANLLQPSVFRPNAWIVQPSADTVGFLHLSAVVLENE